MKTGKSRRVHWLLSSVLAAGAAGYLPFAQSSPLSGVAFAQDRQAEGEEWVKYEEVPQDVKRTLDRVRDNDKGIKKIVHVTRGDRNMYRAIIDERGDDLMVWIDRDGEVLRQERLANDMEVVRGGELQRSGETRSDRVSRDIPERGADRETWVKYEDVPRDVRRTLDRERDGRALRKIARVERGDKVFYRAIVDDRQGDRIVMINPNGRLLTEFEVAEARQASGRLDGTRRGDLDRFNEDEFYDGRTRGDFGEGDRVDFDRLPGEVKAAIGREAGSDRIVQVTHFDARRGEDVYRAVVTSGNRQRVVRVDEQGRVLGARNEQGREQVRFQNLPGPVKTTLGREVNPDNIEAIIQVTRDGQTEYQARIDEGPTTRWLRIDRDGDVIWDKQRDERR